MKYVASCIAEMFWLMMVPHEHDMGISDYTLAADFACVEKQKRPVSSDDWLCVREAAKTLFWLRLKSGCLRTDLFFACSTGLDRKIGLFG